MGQLAADGLLDCLSRAGGPERLAEYWLAVQAGLMKGKMDALTFWLYDQADGSRGKVPLDVQRKEHLEMWMLLGDPALHLPLIHPTIRLESKDAIAAGKQIEVRGTLPMELARCTVKLTLERPTGSRSDETATAAHRSCRRTQGHARQSGAGEFDRAGDLRSAAQRREVSLHRDAAGAAALEETDAAHDSGHGNQDGPRRAITSGEVIEPQKD